MGSRGSISLARRRDLRGCRGFKMDPIDGSCISFDVLQADDASSFKSQDSRSHSSSTLNLQTSTFNASTFVNGLSEYQASTFKVVCLVRIEDFVNPLFKCIYMDLKMLKAQVLNALNALNSQVSWTHSPIIDPFATHQHRCDHSTRIHLWTISSLSISFFQFVGLHRHPSSSLSLCLASRVASCLWTLVSLSAPNPRSLASPLPSESCSSPIRVKLPASLPAPMCII